MCVRLLCRMDTGILLNWDDMQCVLALSIFYKAFLLRTTMQREMYLKRNLNCDWIYEVLFLDRSNGSCQDLLMVDLSNLRFTDEAFADADKELQELLDKVLKKNMKEWLIISCKKMRSTNCRYRNYATTRIQLSGRCFSIRLKLWHRNPKIPYKS